MITEDSKKNRVAAQKCKESIRDALLKFTETTGLVVQDVAFECAAARDENCEIVECQYWDFTLRGVL